MTSLAALWLPILLSAVFVFIASSVFNMLLPFWHMKDYTGFTNEDDVRAAMRGSAPGMYTLPYCTPERMKDPAMKEKLRQGPNAFILIRGGNPLNMGTPLALWFVFCLIVSFLCAVVAGIALPRGAEHGMVFHIALAAGFLGHAVGNITNGIWWGHPWVSVIKYLVDGLIYAAIIGATFCWLWPA